MDVVKMLAALREDLARIDAAIIAVERLAAGSRKRRGRPPGSKNKPKKPPSREGG